MTIINAVAKLVPEPHTVDLSNPDKTIIVEVAKVSLFKILIYLLKIAFLEILSCCSCLQTVCSIGVAKRYKELLKYNLRQLTSPVVQ